MLDPKGLPAALAALAGAVGLHYGACRLAERLGDQACPSPDLLLGILPVLDLRFLYLWGPPAFVAFLVVVAVWRERPRLAYLARMVAGLILAKSVLMVLTPMRIPAGALPVEGTFFYDTLGRFFTVRNDLFFSLHTALPFLGCLLLSDSWARGACLAFSLAMAATVLLSRMHYSVDVAAAYFVTYAFCRLSGDAGACPPPSTGLPRSPR